MIFHEFIVQTIIRPISVGIVCGEPIEVCSAYSHMDIPLIPLRRHAFLVFVNRELLPGFVDLLASFSQF